MKTLLHIPHASLEVPEIFYEGLLISKQEFRRYNLEMTDLGIDELFRDVEGERVMAPYSRLFCDVERFRDDAREPMTAYGEGVVYTKFYDGKEFHRHGEQYRKQVMQVYEEHHRRLDETARRLLEEDGELLILDCHSFSDKMASHFFRPPFPDVCVGVEPEYCDERVLDRILTIIRRSGYSAQINCPYSGSMVPNAVLAGRLTGKVVSIMVEVNKRIYL